MKREKRKETEMGNLPSNPEHTQQRVYPRHWQLVSSEVVLCPLFPHVTNGHRTHNQASPGAHASGWTRASASLLRSSPFASKLSSGSGAFCPQPMPFFRVYMKTLKATFHNVSLSSEPVVMGSLLLSAACHTHSFWLVFNSI